MSLPDQTPRDPWRGLRSPEAGSSQPFIAPSSSPEAGVVPADPVIKFTKLVAPRSARLTVARAALLDRLQVDEPHRLTLFQAPAGFGKTATMVQWRNALIEAGYTVAWLGIDPDDDGESHFLLCLVASLRRSGCEISDGVFATYRRGDPAAAGAFLTVLVNELWQDRHRTFLFVDDLHRASSPMVQHFLLELAQQAPDNFRLVIGSSGRIALPYQYLRSQISVVDARDLTFSLDEAKAFFDDRLGFPLTPEDLRRLYDATQGWIVAMQLAVPAIRSSPDPKQFIRRISGQSLDIAGYLVDDALARLSREHLEFLVRTSFLELLHPDLCGYVASTTESGDVLKAFAEQTVFLVPVTGERQWYRFLPLFADYLRTKFDLLPADERADLHARAARWLGSRELYAQAVDHALKAGRTAEAVEWVAQGVRQLIREGKIVTTLTLIDRIPREQLAQDRRLQLAMALVLSYSSQFREAERILAQLESEDIAGGASPAAEIHLIRARIACFRDDSALAELALAGLVATGAPNDPIYASLYCGARSYIHFVAGRFDEARKAQIDELRWPPDSRGHYSVWLGRLISGLCHAAQGDVARAGEVFRGVLAEAEERVGRRSVPACMAAAGLAWTTYETGRCGEVLSILADRMDVLDATAIPELLIMANVCYSRTLAAAGDNDAAVERIAQLREIGRQRESDRIQAAALMETVRLRLWRGDADAAQGALSELQSLSAHGDPDQPGSDWQTGRFLALSLARCQLAGGRFSEALQTIEERLAQCAPNAHVYRWVQFRTLQAACLLGLGREWLPPLREAWQVAEKLNLRHGIADEGRPVLALIEAVHRVKGLRQLAVSESFVDRLHAVVAASPIHVGAAPALGRAPAAKALLTDTEREVVALVAKGLANKQIANLMNIGLSTVKWHLHNISGKLDAPSRRIVADIARRRGLI